MEIVTIGDREFEISSLTRGQIKKLKEYGFSYFKCDPSVAMGDDAMDAVFAVVLSEEDVAFLDGRENRDQIKIWRAVLSETYGGGADEGNSQGTSDGGGTESGSNTAASAVPEKSSQ